MTEAGEPSPPVAGVVAGASGLSLTLGSKPGLSGSKANTLMRRGWPSSTCQVCTGSKTGAPLAFLTSRVRSRVRLVVTGSLPSAGVKVALKVTGILSRPACEKPGCQVSQPVSSSSVAPPGSQGAFQRSLTLLPSAWLRPPGTLPGSCRLKRSPSRSTWACSVGNTGLA